MRGWENCQAAVVSRELPDLKAALSFRARSERSEGSADAPTGRGATNRTWTVPGKQRPQNKPHDHAPCYKSILSPKRFEVKIVSIARQIQNGGN